MTVVGTLTVLLMGVDAVALAQAAASSPPSTRVDVLEAWVSAAPKCRLQSARFDSAIERSGTAPVTYLGRDDAKRACQTPGWARVRVTASVWVTRRAIRAGEALEPALLREERVLTVGTPLLTLAPGSRASMSVSRGVMLEPRHVRNDGPEPGAAVTVVLVTRGLRIAQPGVAVPCRGDHTCARTASGRRLEGRWVGDTVEVTP